MNYIGEKIKLLRRKRDWTQENLADLLGVSYQSVSKWETGITCPDLGLIVPIARLFGTTTDDILGMENGDARRAEFDEAMKDQSGYSEDRYALAKQAVAEFPDNMEFLFWLATMECTKAQWMERQLSAEEHHDLLESAVKHFKTVLENTADVSQRNDTIWWLVALLGEELDRPEEAKIYWEMYPEAQFYTKAELKVSMLRGEEQLRQMQQVTNTHFMKMLHLLDGIWVYYDQPERDDSESQKPVFEAIIQLCKAMFPDGNYGTYCDSIQMIYTNLANDAVKKGKYDDSVSYLRQMKAMTEHQVELADAGVTTFTSGPLNGFEYSWPDLAERWSACFKGCESSPFFIPLRDRADFKALFAE